MSSESDDPPLKRTDVGYKRPPIETRFKKGQKPPPRKKKTTPSFDAKELLWMILQERRRVVIEGKAVWLTNAELIGRRAFIEAEKGSPVLLRLVNQFILSVEPGEDSQMPEVIVEPDHESNGLT